MIIMKRTWIKMMVPALVVLAGCDTKDRTPIPGKRTDFLQTLTPQSVDANASGKAVIIDPAVPNEAWPQAGGCASHAMPNVQLGDNLKQIYRVSVGAGSYDERRQMSNVVVNNQYAYVLDTQGQVYAVNKDTGEQTWSATALVDDDYSEEMLGGGICVDGEAVFVATSFGRVFAFDTKSGQSLWRADMGAPIRSAATAHEGRLFVITINNTCVALNSQTGQTLWEHQGITEAAALLGSASPAAYGDTVIAAYSSGEVFALQADNGHVLWNEVLVSGMRSDTLSAFPHIRARPIIDRGAVICINYGGAMASFDLKTGQRQWHNPLSGARSPAVTRDFVFALTHDNVVQAVDRDTGHIKWRASLPNIDDGTTLQYAGPVLAGGMLVLTASKGQMVFLSPEDGKEAQRLDIGGSCYLSPVIANNRLFVLEDGGNLSVWG